MKKITLLLMILLLLHNVSAVSANGDIPKGAQEYADKHFLPILLDHAKSPHAGGYNLTESKNITFGSLHPTFTFTAEFVKGKKEGVEGIIQTKEYISVVYQDGKPVNVIGTFQTEAGTFDLSTLGYGLDIAEALDKLKAGEWVFNEAPANAWYVYNGKKLKPLTKSTKDLMKLEEQNVEDYQKTVIERYKDAGQGEEDGMVGGTYVGDTEDGRLMLTLYSVIAVLGLGVIVLFINNRRLKKKHI